MAHWVVVTYERPNTSVAWFTPSSEILDLATEFQNTEPKKITSYEKSESADGLKQYYKIAFKDNATYTEFENTSKGQTNITVREDYLNSVGITYTIDHAGASEPVISSGITGD